MTFNNRNQVKETNKNDHSFHVFMRIVQIVKSNEITLKELKEQIEFNYKAISDSLSLYKEHVRIRPKLNSVPETRLDSELYITIKNSGLNLYIDNSEI